MKTKSFALVFIPIVTLTILAIIGTALWLNYRRHKKEPTPDLENGVDELVEFQTAMHVNHQKLREEQQARVATRASGSGSVEALSQLPRTATQGSHPSRRSQLPPTPPRANTFNPKSRPDNAFNPRLRQEEPRPLQEEQDEKYTLDEQSVGPAQMPPVPRGATSFESPRASQEGSRVSRFQEHLEEGESSKAAGERSIFGPHEPDVDAPRQEEGEEIVLEDNSPSSDIPASRASFASGEMPDHWGRPIDSRLG